MKILVVDDVQAYLGSITRALGREHEVITAMSFNQAKEMMADSVDLALVDVRLSEEDFENKDGVLLLSWLREIYPAVPVIMMSAYKDFDTAVDALNLGAKYYLRKPINLLELQRLIASFAKGTN